MKKKFNLTIFTPTYNRAYILEALYESLVKQSNKNFEWLIIDDDSSDNTDELVNSWINNKLLNINYYKQKHGGKHRAINKASDIANGEYMFIVDSDDTITEDAVECILKWIESIENDVNCDQFCGVAGLRVFKNGKIIGGNVEFKNQYIDASNFEREKYNLLGDKAEIYRTSLLRENKFPEFDGEFFMTEDVCYQEIAAKGYKIRWYNHPIYICEYLEDGLSKTGANEIKGHINNYRGYCYWINRSLKLKPLEYKYYIIKDLIKTKKKMNKTLLNVSKDIKINFLRLLAIIIILCPLSYIKRKIIRFRLKNGEVYE